MSKQKYATKIHLLSGNRESGACGINTACGRSMVDDSLLTDDAANVTCRVCYNVLFFRRKRAERDRLYEEHKASLKKLYREAPNGIGASESGFATARSG